MTIPVVLIDHDCKLEHGLLHDLAECLTVVSARDFGRASPEGYGISATCRVGASLSDVAPGEWVMAFWTHPDVANALGYHDTAPNGCPVMHVFPALDIPLNLGLTASHELFEALADADCSCSEVGDDGVVRAREPGDPCEREFYKYTCAAGRVLRVSDFVLPRYFAPAANGPGKLDFMGRVATPYEILSGGYQIVFDPAAGGWTEQTNGPKRPYRAALEALGWTRRHRREAKRVRAASAASAASEAPGPPPTPPTPPTIPPSAA